MKFEKDENNKIELLIKGFTDNFSCTKEQVYDEIFKCSGEIIDLYYIIEDKYKKQIKVSRRGRPKKI